MGVKGALLLAGLVFGFLVVRLQPQGAAHHRRPVGLPLLPAGHPAVQPRRQVPGRAAPRPRRCARHADRLCRGRSGLRRRAAPGGPGCDRPDRRRVRPRPVRDPDRQVPRAGVLRPRRTHDGPRGEELRLGPRPGRPARSAHRVRAARAVGPDAPGPPSAGRGEGAEGPGQDPLPHHARHPAGAVHRRHRPGRHPDHGRLLEASDLAAAGHRRTSAVRGAVLGGGDGMPRSRAGLRRVSPARVSGAGRPARA